MLKKYSTALLFLGFVVFIGITAVSVGLTRRVTSGESRAVDPDELGLVDPMHAPESGCVSKIGFNTAAAVVTTDRNFPIVADVGKYPGRVQDQIKAFMNCSFPSSNWSNTQSADPANPNPPYWAHIPDVAVANNTYPYRPYQFIGAWYDDPNELYPVMAEKRHQYRFLIFNEPINSYDTNLLSPRAAAERFVQIGNRLSGVDINSAPLSSNQLESLYCCGNHNTQTDQKWMDQFLCHLSGQASCPDYRTGASVSTPAVLVSGQGGYLRYLAGFSWHMLNGHSTAREWSTRLNEIKSWIDGYHSEFLSIANLPQTVVISETGAPLERYWNGDTIFDKIAMVFQRKNEPWLDAVMWNDAFIKDDIFGEGAGIDAQSGLFVCPDCNLRGNDGHLAVTPAGYYFRDCLQNNGVCPDPKSYVPPTEIDGLIGEPIISGDFNVGYPTVVRVPIDTYGDGTWFNSIKWRYISPDGQTTTPNTTCDNEYCEITPDAAHEGWTIEVRANAQQTDPTDVELKHICAKGSSEDGEWTIVSQNGTSIGVPYNNPRSQCANSLAARYTVKPRLTSAICPRLELLIPKYIYSVGAQWVVDPTQELARYYTTQTPVDPSTGQTVTGWSRISMKNGATYDVVCNSGKVNTTRTQQTIGAKGKAAPSNCVIPLPQGSNLMRLRVESVFPGLGPNGSSLVCGSDEFVVNR